MKRLALFLTALTALSLTACSSGDEAGNSATPAVGALANVPPPAGKKWTEVVSETADGGFVMGNPDAPVKVIEFGSFTCPHCRDFSTESSSERDAMVETGKLSFEYRAFVRDPIDMSAALLARCGGADPFFALSEQIFINQEDMMQKAQALGNDKYQELVSKPLGERFGAIANSVGLIDFAKQRGISAEKAKQCLADATTIDKLVKQVQADTAKYNIEGTPTLVMNGNVVENAASWQVMRAKLKEVGL